jgi:hypothetical protein
MIPLSRALTWIVVSIFVVSGTSTYFFKKHLRDKLDRHYNPAYRIASIVQTGPQREALKTTYLAELMQLSVDHPQNIHSFDPHVAKAALLRSHVIKDASVKVMPPQTIYVDYTIRQPVAFLDDYENIAIDEEGYLFPLFPFFPPKKLPGVYFGSSLTNPLQGKAFELALTLVRLLGEPAYKGLFHIRRIDVSNINASSYGRREIVLLTEDQIFQKSEGKECLFVLPRLLRLSLKNYAAELGNYLKLREQLLEQECKNLSFTDGQDFCRLPEKVIDLRLANLAFVQ